MFKSFFPSPKVFFLSALAWSALVIIAWYFAIEPIGTSLGFGSPPPGQEIIGLSVFWSPSFLWFYLYFAVVVAAFYLFWEWYAPHPWARWSILGSALILFFTYFQVQVSVAINNWRGPFFDMIQQALGKTRVVEPAEYYGLIGTFLGIALVAVTVAVISRFFVNHWVFRWRQTMNDYYVKHWERLRSIEGAAQRVQEDTARLARLLETLGVNLIDAIMTLIAFLPILLVLSAEVKSLPLIGEIPYSLVIAAIAWSIFGTIFLALIGIKLPGLEFGIQRVEAAYRKELVFGEDQADRAQPPTLRQLFGNLRKTYFNYYWHYVYFNVGRFFYLQIDNIYAFVILAPTVLIGAITFGTLQKILGAFGQVRESFQFLVYSWPQIVELISIHKRLSAFEATLGDDAPLPAPGEGVSEGEGGVVVTAS